MKSDASKASGETTAAAKARAQVEDIKPGRLFINGKFRNAEGGRTRKVVFQCREQGREN